MCVGALTHDPPCKVNRLRVQGVKFKDFETWKDDDSSEPPQTPKQKRSTVERKEKSRDAARDRRATESVYFQELEDLLPVMESCPNSVAATVDKTSLIRLTLAYLKTRSFIEKGLPEALVKEEKYSSFNETTNLDIENCMNGFSIVLSPFGDVIHVSSNVQKFIGLTPTELTGQLLADYVHPCDHKQLEMLTPDLADKSADEEKEVFVRIKCTVTERGRIINLKQANYKTVKICGKSRKIDCKDGESGLSGTVFLGIISITGPQPGLPTQLGICNSKHSQDMKFLEADSWFSRVAGYASQSLLGQSYFGFIHAADIDNVNVSFKILREHGQCETPAYRFLANGGGWVWIKTSAAITQTRRGTNKSQSVVCQHHQITNVEESHQVCALVQMGASNAWCTSKKDNNESRADMPALSGLPVTSKGDRDFKNQKSVGFDSLRLMEDVMNEDTAQHHPTRPVIILPRQSFKEEELDKKVTTIKTVTSTPTSVIVNHKQTAASNPHAVTQSIFQRVDTWKKNNATPNVHEEAAKPVTSCFFNNHGEKEKENTVVLGDDILTSLLSFQPFDQKLENVAPFGGEGFSTMKSVSEEQESDREFGQIPTFDISGGSDDPFNFLNLEKSVFDELLENDMNYPDDIFINPEKDTMWGVPKQISPINGEIIPHPTQPPPSRDNSNWQTKGKPHPSIKTSESTGQQFFNNPYPGVLRGPDWVFSLENEKNETADTQQDQAQDLLSFICQEFNTDITM